MKLSRKETRKGKDGKDESTSSPWSFVPKASNTVYMLLIAALAVAVNINTINNGFVFDDERGIIKNRDLLSSTPLLDLFYHDYWG